MNNFSSLLDDYTAARTEHATPDRERDTDHGVSNPSVPAAPGAAVVALFECDPNRDGIPAADDQKHR
ncbi:hypothetical protein [Erythrobacter sp. JK5]|uniref:hypothetical protein n=1 Tax=Erythrobacter sp. JK5 TaxID=2829500 RepID=UPI001BA51DD4|nr:hypothetical protein [Erythrobacter sp. JK5]QUL36882.1 hypothetical protein KDC96_10725 [Erythrobacter sp. JK5]